MAHDYTDLDAAIIERITAGCVGFTSLSCAVAKHSEKLASDDQAPAWRIVDRRLQALRKASRIRYQRKPEGWVLGSLRALSEARAVTRGSTCNR